MTIWIDAQLSPSLAKWITDTFGLATLSVRDLGLREAKDFQIFMAARKADAIVLTKDADFQHLLQQHGPPPKVLWITIGNASNQNMRAVLGKTLESAVKLLEAGESIVEITGAHQNG